MITDSLIDNPFTLDGTQDLVSCLGANLALLLGLSRSLSVLIVGPGVEKWCNEFSAPFFIKNISEEIAFPREVDLILWDLSGVAQRTEFDNYLKIFFNILSPTGKLILFAPNLLSFFSNNRCLNVLRFVLKGRKHNRNFYKNTLSIAGFEPVREFLAIPKLYSIEEIVIPHSRFIELPHYWHRLLHLANRLGFFPLLADGSVFLAGKGIDVNNLLISALNDLIAGSTGVANINCNIERIDLRMRGSMVIFVFAQVIDHYYIVRLISNPEICKLVSLNEIFLKKLHDNSNLPQHLKNLLPIPLGSRQILGGVIFVENLMEGVLAWKVNRRGLQKIIHSEAKKFITQFQYHTKQKIFIGDDELYYLIRADLERIETYPDINLLLLVEIKSSVNEICRRLIGRKMFLTASHGDFSYGNILVDPVSGELKGVIDWDTGRILDLPGVDLLTLEVQKNRTDTGCNLATAFKKVFCMVMESGHLDTDGKYRKDLCITPEILPIVLMLTFIRFISRAVRYPVLFKGQQLEYIKVLEILKYNIFERYEKF